MKYQKSNLSKTYSEVIRLETFEERVDYLSLKGRVAKETFGFSRYLNQVLYTSYEWRKLRRDMIVRDNANDVALRGRPIFNQVYVHHINTISLSDINDRNEDLLFNPENLICVSFDTHNLIHYGNIKELPSLRLERTKNDQCPWRNK